MSASTRSRLAGRAIVSEGPSSGRLNVRDAVPAGAEAVRVADDEPALGPARQLAYLQTKSFGRWADVDGLEASLAPLVDDGDECSLVWLAHLQAEFVRSLAIGSCAWCGHSQSWCWWYLGLPGYQVVSSETNRRCVGSQLDVGEQPESLCVAWVPVDVGCHLSKLAMQHPFVGVEEFNDDVAFLDHGPLAHVCGRAAAAGCEPSCAVESARDHEQVLPGQKVAADPHLVRHLLLDRVEVLPGLDDPEAAPSRCTSTLARISLAFALIPLLVPRYVSV